MVTVLPSGTRPIEGKLLFLLDRVKTIVYLREKRKGNLTSVTEHGKSAIITPQSFTAS